MKGPLYRSDDYLDEPGCPLIGIEGTREEVEAYENAKADPATKLHFPYKVFSNSPLRDGALRVWQIRPRGSAQGAPHGELETLLAFAEVGVKVGEYKKARIEERGEQHLNAQPHHPILWRIKGLFAAYDEAADLARKL
ncbi:MAG: hypothetical protein WC822_01125 [Candidatus Paceibacterota bacterium]|jgi:hypothetical protein